MHPDEPVAPTDTVAAFMGQPTVLARGPAHGPLGGVTVAVKDLFDVAGTVTYAGNPDFGAHRRPATHHAEVVERLVTAGATVMGRTITDELAYSLSGTNHHFGTPVNVAAPDRIPGGSSAGSAAAVAAALVDLGVGTDTAGSVRVPASYCGIWGWRSTHGAVPLHGVVPLAPSFDTVGLFARDPVLLARAAAVALGPTAQPRAHRPVRLVQFMEAFDTVDTRVAQAATTALEGLQVEQRWIGVDLDEALAAQRTLQQFEAWHTHGPWITQQQPHLGPGIAARFRAASRVSADDVAAARPVAHRVRDHLVGALRSDDESLTVMVLPAAAGAAPRRQHADHVDEHERQRTNNLRLTCIAGLAGTPVVVAPIAHVDSLPLGVAFMSAPHTDLELLAALCARITSGDV
jgi:amidase